MKGRENTRQIDRYIALDIHKEYVLVGGQNAKQEWVLSPRRISMAKFPEWAIANLQEGDAVVLETTTNVWDIYDIVAPQTTRTVVAHAGAVRQIAEARVKTDKEDVTPALAGGARETGAVFRNRLQSLLHSHNLVLPDEGLLNQAWWDQQEKISELEKLQIRQELAMLEQIEKHKAEVDQELGRQSLGERWGQEALRLLQLPGIGVVIAMTILSAIGEISRFENADKLVGYAGLGAGVHTCTCVRCKCDSGKEHIEKRITKSGRKELRWALVEAAWRAVRMSPY